MPTHLVVFSVLQEQILTVASPEALCLPNFDFLRLTVDICSCKLPESQRYELKWLSNEFQRSGALAKTGCLAHFKALCDFSEPFLPHSRTSKCRAHWPGGKAMTWLTSG